MTSDDFRDTVLNFLRDSGRGPVEITPGGFIQFTLDGHMFWIHNDPRDVQYVRVLFPGIYVPSSEADQERAAAVALRVASRLKVVKLSIEWGSVWVSYQALHSPEAFMVLFDRVLRMLQNAAQEFLVEMGVIPGDSRH
jgi:hypothetical protein